MPSSRAHRCARRSSGPSPTSSSRAGTFCWMRLKMSTTASTRLTGRKFETWMTILRPVVAAGEVPAKVRPRPAAMDGAVEEVRNDRDVPRHLQLRVGGLAQAVRHRRHAIGLLDRERHDLRVRRIVADQRDVGAVQRRHDLRRLTGCRQHLTREKPGRRVRHRVVRVDDVQAELARHLDDAVGQRQQILRLAKQRIRRRRDLVEEQPFLEIAEPERRLGADEVRLMAAQRQGLPQLGRHHAAASDRRVADDADVQGRAHSWRRCGRTSGCFTTMPSANATPARAPNCASRLSIELPEPDRRQTRRHGVGLRRLELRDVTRQRAALRLVVLAHVHDERRRGHVVDEVVADRLGLPRVAFGLIAAKAGAEHAFGEQMARRDVIGMAIGPVRDARRPAAWRDRTRPATAR